MHDSNNSNRGGFFNWFRKLLECSRERRERALHRRYLLEMDDRMLKDIGLSRADALQWTRRNCSREKPGQTAAATSQQSGSCAKKVRYPSQPLG